MRLRRVDCAGAGIRRVRRGRGFSYVDSDGKRISDPATLDRIKALVIPPAWEDVWICSVPNGHIQAVGTDSAGRRQYLYHEAWRVARDREKHERMVTFARRLPAARKRMKADLQGSEPTRRRVLGGAARLLDLGFFRVGSESYEESYGLATLLREDVTVSRNGTVTFDYIAKGGIRRELSLGEPELHKLIATLKRRKDDNPELLAYKTPKGWRDVKSSDINAYLAEIMRGDFTAKDFRTWHATVLCAVGLAVARDAPETEAARKRAVAWAVKETADKLGNTPSVARSSYIDPRIVDRYNDNRTIRAVLDRLGEDSDPGELATQGPIEAAVLRLLRD
ncbi:MAG: DNA topoisomerase IB [Frankiaceae bacterium]|nr:DNA topoisomerase IB [Frankiaceae bacterium]